MQEFVTHQNIRRFERMLELESDPSKREVLKRLLDIERAKLDDLERQIDEDA